MKTVLCFGDSNTWGYDPIASSGRVAPVRHPESVRWTGILQRLLGDGWRVVEEGLNGRTTVHQDPLEEGRCGFSYLGPCLQSHKPIHAVVLLLGTNDLKARFGLPPADVAEGAAVLAQVVQRSGTGPEGVAPALLLVCPPAIVEVGHLPLLAEKFGGAAEKSQRLPSLYEAWAQRLGCAYLDAQEVVEPSLHDGLHLEAREHQKLGEAITKAVRQLV